MGRENHFNNTKIGNISLITDRSKAARRFGGTIAVMIGSSVVGSRKYHHLFGLKTKLISRLGRLTGEDCNDIKQTAQVKGGTGNLLT